MPVQALIILVRLSGVHDVLEDLVASVADSQVVGSRAIHLESYLEDEGGVVAQIVTLIGVLYERGMDEELHVVGLQSEPRYELARVDQQVLAGRQAKRTVSEPLFQFFGLRKDKDALSLLQPMARFLAPDDHFTALIVAGAFLEQHARRHPQLPDLDAVLVLILRRVLEPKKLGAVGDVVVVAVGERDDIEVVAFGCLELLAQRLLQVNKGAFRIFAIGTMAEVEQETLGIGEHDLARVAVAYWIKTYLVHGNLVRFDICFNVWAPFERALESGSTYSVRPLAPRSPLTDRRRPHLQASCERSCRSALRDRELYEPPNLLLGGKAVSSTERVFW